MQQDNSKKVNLYYSTVYKRQNGFKMFFLGLAYSISSYPRLIMEVFIRRSMGERYYNLGAALFIGIILTVLPFALTSGFAEMSTGELTAKYLSWYLFFAAFFYFNSKRYLEIKREPSVYDFGKFSMSTGISLPIFRTITLFGKRANPRRIAIIYEPGLFVIGGLVLYMLGQQIGLLCMVCGLIYSLSYMAAYKMGDEFVMDQIDKMICNEEMYDSFVLSKMPEETRGFNFFGRGPQDEQQREDLMDSFFEDIDEPAAMAS